MRKILLLFIVFFLLFNQNICNAAALLDGNGWIEFGKAKEKIVGRLYKGLYIRGLMEGSGYIAVNVEQLIKEIKELKTKVTGKLDEGEAEFVLELINKELQRWVVFNISFEQIIDGLDVLYEDFKNRNINIAYAIHVVKKQIRGASEEEINAILEYLRGGMEDKSKLKYKDKTGKLQEAKFP